MGQIKKNKRVEEALRNMDFKEQIMIAKINTERQIHPEIIGQTIQEKKMNSDYAQNVIVALGGISDKEIIAAIEGMDFEESQKFLRKINYKQRDKFMSNYFSRYQQQDK